MLRNLCLSIPLLLSGNAQSDPAAEYAAAVLATNPVAFWKMNEGTGTAIVNSSTTTLPNGTYTGITWGAADGRLGDAAPTFDGTNDYGSVISSELFSAMDLSEGCCLIWAKVAGSGVWTDGANRSLIELRIDATNFLSVRKTSVNNTLQVTRLATGTTKFTNHTTSSTAWFSVFASWSVSGNYLRLYLNGSLVGTPDSGIVAMTGSAFTRALIGANATTPTQVWSGVIAPVVVWDTPITGAEDARLALGIPA